MFYLVGAASETIATSKYAHSAMQLLVSNNYSNALWCSIYIALQGQPLVWPFQWVMFGLSPGGFPRGVSPFRPFGSIIS